MSGQDFWSRRRAGVQAEQEAEERAEREAELAAVEEMTDEEILAELELPDPDSLEAGDDFTAFMQAAVPQRLKRRALRRLWATNPMLANLDGLIDYGEDYTDAATIVENMTTAYQVGKGMTKHVEEMLRQAAEAERAAEAGETPEPLVSLDEEADEDAEDEDAAAQQDAECVGDGDERVAQIVQETETEHEIINTATEEISLKPGRMRYHFEAEG